MSSRFSFSGRRGAFPKRAIFAAVALAVIVGLVLYFRPYQPSLGRVAIGGGAYHGVNSTDSIQALDTSWDKGFRTFQIQLRWTKDRALVCLPNWREGAAAVFKNYTLANPPRQLTLAEFTSQPTVEDIHLCTLDTLNTWLKAHPGATLVVNLPPRGKMLEGFQLVKNTMQDVSHVVPEVYKGKEYRAVMAMGYSRAILVLQNPPHKPNIGKLRDGLRALRPYAVAIPADRTTADDPLIKRLKEVPTLIYVMGVDDCAELKRLQGLGVTDAYTNQLSPQDCPL